MGFDHRNRSKAASGGLSSRRGTGAPALDRPRSSVSSSIADVTHCAGAQPGFLPYALRAATPRQWGGPFFLA